jgi:hypothetical protein
MHGEVNNRLPLHTHSAIPVPHTAREAWDRRYVSGKWDRQMAAIAQEEVFQFLNTDWEVGVVAAGFGDQRLEIALLHACAQPQPAQAGWEATRDVPKRC